VTINVLASTGRHRLTYRKRAARVWTRLRYGIPFAAVVLFWGLVVAMSGFVAGWVWAQAL
jgi:hypothetical protein